MAEFTDEQIEAFVQKHGAKWDGNHWTIEDADLHPLIRAALSAPQEAGKAEIASGETVDYKPSVQCICGAEWECGQFGWEMVFPPDASKEAGKPEPCATIADCTTPKLCLSVGTCKGYYVMPASVRESASKEAGKAEPDMRAICEALGFDPTNHHNAAKCPYCRPPEPKEAGKAEPCMFHFVPWTGCASCERYKASKEAGKVEAVADERQPSDGDYLRWAEQAGAKVNWDFESASSARVVFLTASQWGRFCDKVRALYLRPSQQALSVEVSEAEASNLAYRAGASLTIGGQWLLTKEQLRAILALASGDASEARKGWVSVEERMPEHGDEVFITGYQYSMPEKGRFYAVAHYHSDGMFFDNETGDDFYRPTHWMVPAAPSQNGGSQ